MERAREWLGRRMMANEGEESALGTPKTANVRLCFGGKLCLECDVCSFDGPPGR